MEGVKFDEKKVDSYLFYTVTGKSQDLNTAPSDSQMQTASHYPTLQLAMPGELVSSPIRARWDPDPRTPPLLFLSPLKRRAITKRSQHSGRVRPRPATSFYGRLSSLGNMG